MGEKTLAHLISQNVENGSLFSCFGNSFDHFFYPCLYVSTTRVKFCFVVVVVVVVVVILGHTLIKLQWQDTKLQCSGRIPNCSAVAGYQTAVAGYHTAVAGYQTAVSGY
jgi:hypothetical protein